MRDMHKNIPKRYVSEKDVLKALKIDSFRNLSKEKMMEFASMLPYMDKDVALAIIDQFPKFVEFAKTAIESYTQICNSILEKNDKSQTAVIQGYQTILDALAKQLEKPNLTEESRKSITEDMISVADKIAMADERNKKFFLDALGKIGLSIGGVLLVVGAAIGINAKFGNTTDIPQLGDDDPDNDDYNKML